MLGVSCLLILGVIRARWHLASPKYWRDTAGNERSSVDEFDNDQRDRQSLSFNTSLGFMYDHVHGAVTHSQR